MVDEQTSLNGGSIVGCDECLFKQYCAQNPIYIEDDIRRLHRMNKRLFQRFLNGILSVDDYIFQKPDASRKMVILTQLKVTCLIIMLEYGPLADLLDDNLEMGEFAIIKCLERICEAVVRHFGEEF